MATANQVENAKLVLDATGYVKELPLVATAPDHAQDRSQYSDWLGSLALVAGDRPIEFMTFTDSYIKPGVLAQVRAWGLVGPVLVRGDFKFGWKSQPASGVVEVIRLRDVKTWALSAGTRPEAITADGSQLLRVATLTLLYEWDLTTMLRSGDLATLQRSGDFAGRARASELVTTARVSALELESRDDEACIKSRVPEMIETIISRLVGD